MAEAEGHGGGHVPVASTSFLPPPPPPPPPPPAAAVGADTAVSATAPPGGADLPPAPIAPSNNGGVAGAGIAGAPGGAISAAGGGRGAGRDHQLYTASGRKRKHRTSGVWKYFEQFSPATPKGRNVRCTVMVEAPADAALGLPKRSVMCGATYTHVESRPGNGGSGTSGMLHHLSKKHPLIHAEIVRAGPSTKARKLEGSAAKGGDSSGPASPPSPGRAGAGAGAQGLGGGSAAAVEPWTAEERLPHDRRFVLMCALQTLNPDSLGASAGFRLFLDRLSPGYAARTKAHPAPPAPPASAGTNAILRDLGAGVRREVAAALTAPSESCRRLGWAGPFVCLQVDSTGMAATAFGRAAAGSGGWGGEEGGSDELCTASVSFVPPDFGGLVRLAIGARCFFRAGGASQAKEAWIRELTADLFVGVCGKSEPRDVYLAGTVGGWGGSAAGGDGVCSSRRALQNAGIPVLVCSSYRLQSAVTRAFGGGCGGGGGGGGGGHDRIEEATANTKMRDVVRRAMSMVEIFEHWRPAAGAYAAAAAAAADSTSLPETPGAEVEELVVTLARARGSNARWTEYHALLERLLHLAGPLETHFREKPSASSLARAEWQAIREAASILEPALEVAAKVHGRGEREGAGGDGIKPTAEPGSLPISNGDRREAAAAPGKSNDATTRGVSLAESIELHANLHCSFVYPLQDIKSYGSSSSSSSSCGGAVGAEGAAAAAAAAAGDFCSKRFADLTPEAQDLLGSVSKDMEETGLGRAREEPEAVSMLLDPRFKQCCASTCVNGGNALKLRALTAVSAQLRNFKDPAEGGAGEGGNTEGGGGGGSAAASPPASQQGTALSRLEKMRQAQKLGAEAAAAAAAAGGAASAAGLSAGEGAGASGAGGGSHRLAEDALAELGEYMLEPAGRRHELLPYWKLNGTDTRDSGTGQVVLAARWPHLALLARLYAGIDPTSRQGERHFESDGGDGGRGDGADIGAAVSLLQRSGMPPWRIEELLLVRLNRHLVPEFADFRRR